VVQVLPHASAPGAQAALGLRAVLAASLGEGLQLQLAPAVAYGAEEAPLARAPEPGTTLRLVLVDLNATPEAETHGRLLQTLQAAPGALPLLLLADEAAFARRFTGLPERLAQRRAAWQQLARAQAVPVVFVNLEQPDVAQAKAALQAALHGSGHAADGTADGTAGGTAGGTSGANNRAGVRA
jgi:hypothetical protein